MIIEQILTDIHALEETIRLAEVKRNQSVFFYRRCIAEADDVFRTDTADARFQLERLIGELKTYYDENPPLKGKSHKFAGGKFGYSKQTPKFFCDGKPAAANNPALLNYAKNYAPQFVKFKEFVDWASLKKELLVDDGIVFRESTGETVPEIKAYVMPDKFSVKTTDSPLKKSLDVETLRSMVTETEAEQ